MIKSGMDKEREEKETWKKRYLRWGWACWNESFPPSFQIQILRRARVFQYDFYYFQQALCITSLLYIIVVGKNQIIKGKDTTQQQAPENDSRRELER